MSQENVEIVRRALEVFQRENTAGSFAGLLAEDFELQPAFEVAGGDSFIGGDGFTRFMSQWTESFDDWAFETLELFDAGDNVVARIRQRARGKASGTPVDLVFGMVFRLRAHLIARMELYITEAEAFKAAGLAE